MSKRMGYFIANGNGVHTWRRVGSLARELAIHQQLGARGWAETLFTYDSERDPGPLPLPPSARIITKWPLGWMRWKLRKLYYALIPFLYFFHGRRLQVLMTDQAGLGWPALWASKVWDARLLARCGYVYGAQAEQAGWSGPAHDKRITAERKVFTQCDAAVTPTPELKAWVVAHYGLPAARVHVIPNYVETERFAPDPAVERTPNSVLMVGRLHPNKRIEVVIRALAGSDYTLTLIGSGALKRELQALAAELGVTLNLIDRVPNEELPRYFQSHAVYVLMGLTEGHPKALIEAMASGAACIGAPTPGVGNILADGDNALVCEAEPEAVRSGLDRLFGDAALRARLGENGRRTVCERYALERVAAHYDRVLTALAERSPLEAE
ncbi:glycosyltransferase family 4 protein [Magnetofaba australis]|uniref:Putative group 1 glycosyl transferase n=1 Tax=Magnetofaba australis IT-1 TaxID=1434232 RepID=A0A1Y2K8P3_9PROT|nr:glycosyltransferase family 4 protein [Magnetofaba australis]OSM07111.1 putative group 1 glycosyl transferase [Magnetofaba australis IT-1]